MDGIQTISTSTPPFDMEKRVQQLEEQSVRIRAAQDNLIEKNRYHEACVNQFMDMLLAYVASDEIDSDVAEVLADCFGRDLSRKVTVNVDIRAELELVLPAGVDLESAMEEIDFGPNVHYATGIEIEYSDISSMSFEEAR